MAYQILNNLGEVEKASISQEELDTLIAESGESFNFFQYDANPENDLVTRWAAAAAEGHDVSNHKIYKLIEE